MGLPQVWTIGSQCDVGAIGCCGLGETDQEGTTDLTVGGRERENMLRLRLRLFCSFCAVAPQRMTGLLAQQLLRWAWYTKTDLCPMKGGRSGADRCLYCWRGAMLLRGRCNDIESNICICMLG